MFLRRVGAVLLLVYSLTLAWMFMTIMLYGWVTISEPRRWWLAVELVISVCSAVLALWLLRADGFK